MQRIRDLIGKFNALSGPNNIVATATQPDTSPDPIKENFRREGVGRKTCRRRREEIRITFCLRPIPSRKREKEISITP
jgi:hypothetical protein